MSTIKGMDGLKKAFRDLGKRIERNTPNALKLTANAYKNDVQDGAPYKSGNLKRSIHVELVSSDTALVGTNLEYAAPLEYGTVKMAARPYFRPPLDTNRAHYQEILKEALMR